MVNCSAIGCTNRSGKTIVIRKLFFIIIQTKQTTNIFRIVFNILIKILYLVANLVCFLGLDRLLNGEYLGYGNKWIQWSNLDNAVQYDYMGMRDHPKPGLFN